MDIVPGALLRTYGNLTPELRIKDARWPLAGIRVTAAGVTGRLQAIVDAQDSYWGVSICIWMGRHKRFGQIRAIGNGAIGERKLATISGTLGCGGRGVGGIR